MNLLGMENSIWFFVKNSFLSGLKSGHLAAKG